MADPRFYDNRGPFTLAAICAKAGIVLPSSADGVAQVFDLASLDGAGPLHLSFFSGHDAADGFARSAAGYCLVSDQAPRPMASPGMILLPCTLVDQAFSAIANLFYPGAVRAAGPQGGIDPSAVLGADVVLERGVVIGPLAEIGRGSKIGAGSVIAACVAIGQDCEIGSNVTISHAYLGDRVVILAGARIGQASSGGAMAELGRVIIQDGVRIGAGAVIDRGALGDTVIGEGSRVDDLIQVRGDVHVDRHSHIPGGQDYGGVLAKAVRE